jgi:hypothetical protein
MRCACYELTFTKTALTEKKKAAVQVTNSGNDQGDNQFDIQIPGGGLGYFDGCTQQWPEYEFKWDALTITAKSVQRYSVTTTVRLQLAFQMVPKR